MLALVDDVQWLDAPSRECVLYAARRAAGAVGFVLAVRDLQEEDADCGYEHLPALRLGPLRQEHSLEVLRHSFPDLVWRVAQALAKAAAGNPLALTELPATLSLEQRAPDLVEAFARACRRRRCPAGAGHAGTAGGQRGHGTGERLARPMPRAAGR